MAKTSFYDDWIEIMRSSLTTTGYTIPATASQEDVACLYFNVQRRMIFPSPRTVQHAKSLVVLADVRHGVQMLEDKFVRGQDVTTHLSTGLRNAGYNDGLLNDWGVYHFHLGTTLATSGKAAGFTARTGNLLYAYITKTDVYFLKVAPHGNWSDQELVETLNGDWPSVMLPFKLKGFAGTGSSTQQQIAELRAGGVYQPLVMKDQTVYALPGGGTATDRSGADNIRKHDQFAAWLKAKEKSLLTAMPTIQNQMRMNGLAVPADTVFRLVHRGGDNFLAVEMTTDFEVNLASL